MTQVRWVAGLSCALAALGVVAPAAAQPRAPVTSVVEGQVIEGRVLEVQGAELVLDLGTSTGLREGQRVQIWRPVALRHPVTKRTISDRFLIGELELVQVRPSMTLARPAGETARPPQLGDIILLPAPTPVDASPPAPAPLADPAGTWTQAPGSAALPADARADRIGKMLLALRGAPPLARAQAYANLARSDPASPYAAALLDEAAVLRDVRRDAGPAVPVAVQFPRMDEVREGEPLRIAVEITNAAGAVLHVRSAEDPSFVTIPMQGASGDYFAATVPAKEVDGTRLEVFVEAVDRAGRPVAVLGSSESPFGAEVRPRPIEAAPDNFLATAKLWTDYADYNRMRGDDYAWQTEGEFGLRLRGVGVRAIRSGFGIYRGQGGSVEDLDELGLEPRSIGLTYGYLEGELAPSHSFAIIPRAIVGLGDDGVAGGAQLLFRIGNDLETNLVLGGEALGTVGVRGIAQLELAVFARVPILFRTEVSNQPAGSEPSSEDFDPDDPRSLEGTDIGARGIAEVGYRVVGSLVLRARGSFQGRTIEHAGPGFGGGVSYSW